MNITDIELIPLDVLMLYSIYVNVYSVQTKFYGLVYCIQKISTISELQSYITRVLLRLSSRRAMQNAQDTRIHWFEALKHCFSCELRWKMYTEKNKHYIRTSKLYNSSNTAIELTPSTGKCSGHSSALVWSIETLFFVRTQVKNVYRKK